MVVNTSSMDGGMARGDGAWYFFDQGVGVSHFNYFHNPRTRDRLLGWLVRPTGAPPDAGFQKRTRSAPAAVRSVSPDAKATAGFPVLFILPGIMGTLLGEMPQAGEPLGERHILWPNQQRLALKGLRQLELDGSDALKPLGLVEQNYGAIAEHFSNTYEVLLFGCDWRRSVADAGIRLAETVAEQVKAGRTVRLLAHSIGGLVARAMIAEKPDLWDAVCANGGRLILLGTPNRGSYVIPRMLWGVDEMVRMLDLVDPEPVDELCKVFARWPGLLEMLPEEPAPREAGAQRLVFGRFFDHQWWHTHRGEQVAPTAEALAAARTVREKLNATPLRHVVYVTGIAAETPAGLSFDGDSKNPKWEVTAEGDGTVPYALGQLQRTEDRLNVFYLDALHGDLANHPAGFKAIGELLKKGEPDKLPTALAPSTAAPRDGVLRDDAPLLFPGEEDLLAVALRSRPHRPATRQPALPPLQVTVFHGDLRLSPYPVIVGHYVDDKIVHAERVLDEQLEERLTCCWKLGLYTGAEGEAELLLAPDCQPAGAIIVGLGEIGALSARKLERGVREAALRYGMHLFSQRLAAGDEEDARPPAGLGVLLLGTNGGNALRIIDSVAAIIAGIREVNRRLHETLPRGHRVSIEALHIIEGSVAKI